MPPVPGPDLGVAIGRLPPSMMLLIDPVTGLPTAGVNDPDAIAIAPIPPVTLTLAQPNRTIDLTQIFTSKFGGQLYYEILGGNSDSLGVKLAGNQLQLSALGKAGVNNVAIRVIDNYGNFSTANFSVTANTLNPANGVQQSLNIKQSLDDLTAVLEQNPEDLLAGFETPEGEQALESLTGLLDENPDLLQFLTQPESLFENIITVGAVNQFEGKTDYSGYGDGLTLMAPGGTWNNNPNAFVGTSRATSYVTAAASLVWAANPELNLKQVKQLLIDSAADLNAPGWDETTGFGLIDVKEAIRRSQLIEPDLSEVKPVAFTPSLFSGQGRAETLARPSSEETEKAIEALQSIQESLLEQWQTLADLGNPALTLADLSADVKQKIAATLDEYQQVSTDAGITTAQAQQWAEALALATQHYQIEKTRLQTLLQQQKELQAQLVPLGQQKSALETETQKMLADIQQQIGVAESDLAKAQAKLTNIC